MRENLSRLAFCLLLLLGLLVVANNVLSQDKPVTIDVAPRSLICTSYQWQQARVLIRITPHPDNRYLQLAWSSDVGQSGSTLMELPGERAAMSYTRWVQINCNYYLFTACVLRTQGKRYCAKQEVRPP